MLTEDSNYPCILQGLVLPGLQIGKGKGFATANIDPLTNEKVIASIGHGVYWGILWICKDKLTCSSHETGLRTVFSVGLSVAHSAPSIEAHIIDPSYSGEDLYNNYIYILVLGKLRNMMKISNDSEGFKLLGEQIKSDVAKAQDLIDKSPFRSMNYSTFCNNFLMKTEK